MPEQAPPLEPAGSRPIDETTAAAGSGPRGRLRPASEPWVAWAASVALIVQLLAIYLPGSTSSSLAIAWLPEADKIVHLVIFAAPTYLFGRLTRRVGLVAAGFAVHAVVSELVQWRFVPFRDGDPRDALADLAGIVLAVLLIHRRPGR